MAIKNSFRTFTSTTWKTFHWVKIYLRLQKCRSRWNFVLSTSKPWDLWKKMKMLKVKVFVSVTFSSILKMYEKNFTKALKIMLEQGTSLKASETSCQKQFYIFSFKGESWATISMKNNNVNLWEIVEKTQKLLLNIECGSFCLTNFNVITTSKIIYRIYASSNDVKFINFHWNVKNKRAKLY